MSASINGPLSGRPVIFGEALFDCFADGAVLGGAPFNVAWHLQGFGLKPLFLSRVGMDERGNQVRSTMEEWGMETRYLQRDPERPTGTVQIQLQHGQPSFDILPRQAYDFIDPSAIADLDRNGLSLLYHGSLAARSAISRETLTTLRRSLALPTFVDINLRPPWWQRETVLPLLQGARWVKLNDAELLQLAQTAGGHDSLEQSAATFRLEQRIGTLLVTLGAEGALVQDGRGLRRAAPAAVSDIADTVGAGDAFSAVTILGISRGWSLETILQRAIAFAAAICRVRGATVREQAFYQEFLANWEN